METRNWQKPILIVLLRSKPEELVLTVCKGGAWSGAATYIQSCEYSLSYPGGPCVTFPPCSTVAAS